MESPANGDPHHSSVRSERITPVDVVPYRWHKEQAKEQKDYYKKLTPLVRIMAIAAVIGAIAAVGTFIAVLFG